MKQRSGLWAVVVGGSIAGALDILFAISYAGYNGMPPARLLQTVASACLVRRHSPAVAPLRQPACFVISPWRTCGQAFLWPLRGVYPC
jgi:hypothetical protein